MDTKSRPPVFLIDGSHFIPDAHLKQSKILFLVERNILKKNNNYYYLNYVGVFELDGGVYVVFPKTTDLSLMKDKKYGSVLLKTLLKFKKDSFDNVKNKDVDKELFLDNLYHYFYVLRDFQTHGLLNFKKNIKSKNGRGKINWKSTISSSLPILDDSKSPIYFDTDTIHPKNDLTNEILEIQKYCVSKANLFVGWSSTSRIDDEILDNNRQSLNIDRAVTILKKELRGTFDDRKVFLFKHMIGILENNLGGENDRLMGVTSYWRVWEHMCSSVFNNCYFEKYSKHIPKPVYVYENGKYSESPRQRLDIISESETHVCIIDAKYYDVRRTVPEWGDIVKQLFYKESIRTLTPKIVFNMFCFPEPAECNKPSEIKFVGTSTTIANSFDKISCIYFDIWQISESYITGYDVLSDLDSKLNLNIQYNTI